MADDSSLYNVAPTLALLRYVGRKPFPEVRDQIEGSVSLETKIGEDPQGTQTDRLTPHLAYKTTQSLLRYVASNRVLTPKQGASIVPSKKDSTYKRDNGQTKKFWVDSKDPVKTQLLDYQEREKCVNNFIKNKAKKKDNTKKLWEGKPAGYDLQTNQEGDDLIIKYTGLVERIAGRLAKRLPPNVQLDELIGIGYEALITFARSGTVKRGNTEQSYLQTRINGAMIDELRKRDIVPRSVRNAKRDIKYVKNGLTELLGRTPTREEIREELGWTKERFELYLNSNLSALISIDAPVGEEGGATLGDLLTHQDDTSAEETIAREALKVFSRQLLERLPEREKRIMQMRFIDGMTLKEIGIREGLTESRISQICTWAKQHLRQGSDIEDYR